MTSITTYLYGIPENYRPTLRDNWNKFSGLFAAEQVEQLTDNKVLMASLGRVWTSSRFILDFCLKNPQQLLDLSLSNQLHQVSLREDFQERLSTELPVIDVSDFMARLRRWRNREMVRLAWRDIADWASIEQTIEETSWLAEVCIEHALQYVYSNVTQRYGIPLDHKQKPMQLAVLGMGKLGGWELNFSSDIDLIFAYSDEGKLQDRRETTHQEFFTRVAQQLIQVLDQITEDGFVFRVDVRLRPFGQSGPLVMSKAAMEQYYEKQAREWERYSMIKCRPVAGDKELGESIVKMLNPFIYRSYLDFGALDELRALKISINRQVLLKEQADNIKLGRGGIREIEFIGQVFQLILAGKKTELQGRQILPLLQELGNQGLLPENESKRLMQSYRQLRRIENRLQQYADKQCHELPASLEKQRILALSLNFFSWDALDFELKEIRNFVHHTYQTVFAISSHEEPGDMDWVWLTENSAEQLSLLEKLGFDEASLVAKQLHDLRESASVGRLSKRGRNRLDRLMPDLLPLVLQTNDPLVCLTRLTQVLESIVCRSVYLALLLENQSARKQLIKLLDASAWIASNLAKTPMLIDELLDPELLYQPLSREALTQQIEIEISATDANDLEGVMNALRHFKQANVLRVAASDIADLIPVMVVSDYLTDIAEVTLRQALDLAWSHVGHRYGFPEGLSDGHIKGFAIIAYGKLGGKELGYASDLDLVFLYGNASDNQRIAESSDCEAQFYARVGQKLISLLNTRMLNGVAYEIDMRLRPSGHSGLLVSHVNAFEQYQHNDAWVWELQALVKARFICGDTNLGDRFNQIKREVLTERRDPQMLQDEVRSMREKMRSSLDQSRKNEFDLKQGAGGIADIEFIVQFEVLLHAHDYPVLCGSTDVVRLVAWLEAGELIRSADAESLRQAYFSYREFGHRSALQDLPNRALDDRFAPFRARVSKVWQSVMELPLTK